MLREIIETARHIAAASESVDAAYLEPYREKLRTLLDRIDAIQAIGPYRAARKAALRDFDRRYLAGLMAAHGGHVTSAAKTAGMSRERLHRKLQEALS